MSNNVQGYLLSAIGVNHILMAHNFAITLRVNQDPRPVAIIVKPEHVEFARDLEFIDFVIPYKPTHEYGPLTDHERFCGMAKLDYHNSMPCDSYIMIDTDFLVGGPTEHVWKMLEAQDAPIVNFGFVDAPYWHWNQLPEIEKKTNLKLSYTCGDIVFFNKNHSDFQNLILRTKDIFLNKYDEYGCKRLFGPQRSKTEEVAFSIASSELGLKPVEMHTFPVINYNPEPGQSYRQFMHPFKPVEDKNTYFGNGPYPCFLHMWDKFFGINYQRVFFEIISGIAKINANQSVSSGTMSTDGKFNF